MVGIYCKKGISHVVHLESYTSYKEYKETHKIKVPIDSFICYAMQKFCNSDCVVIRFIPIRKEPEDQKPSVTLVEGEDEEFSFLMNEKEIPWTVALCEYPVIMAEDVIVTGLCAVARQICMFRNSYILPQEHEDGLLGFRHTCLQAPNEVSVWTKYCEIEIIRTVEQLLKADTNKIVTLSVDYLINFEEHMRHPAKIHNVYKVAQDLKKESLRKKTGEVGEANKEEINAQKQKNLGEQANKHIRTADKQAEQKTKSKRTNVDCCSMFVKKTADEQAEQKTKSKQTNVDCCSMYVKKTADEQAEQKAKSKQTNVDCCSMFVKKTADEQAEQKTKSKQTNVDCCSMFVKKTADEQAEQKTKSQANDKQAEQKAKSKQKDVDYCSMFVKKLSELANAQKNKLKGKSKHTHEANEGLKAEHSANVKEQVNAQEASKCNQKVKSMNDTNVEQQANPEKAQHQTNADQGDSSDELENSEKSDDLSDLKECTTKRISKARKWKSHKKKNNTIDSSMKIEDLEVAHVFAEGPFLTLADLVLLPSFHVIIQSVGKDWFSSQLPYTYKWYKNLTSINKIQETFMPLMNHFDIKMLQFDIIRTSPTAGNVSLYKCDPKRHNPKKRIYTNNDDVEKALSAITEGLLLPMSENEYQLTFEWDDIPEHANPFAGYLPNTRVQRKSEQLQNLALPVLKMAKDGDVIVDFCCGTGHLGILLAYLLPRCTIILLENKVESLCRARERVKKMRLTNVYHYQCNLDFFTGKFDIGIGLHACGVATDLIMNKCINQNAKFVISPCCYGGLHGSCRMHFPRSIKFAKANIDYDDYLFIAHAADQTHKDHPLTARGARCMTVIDSDRARLAEEYGYKVTLTKLKPVTCTPKNNLLIGIPTA